MYNVVTNSSKFILNILSLDNKGQNTTKLTRKTRKLYLKNKKLLKSGIFGSTSSVNFT